jgi:hypothetical protein
MDNTGNKVYNIYINSANRGINEKPYDFTVFFDNQEIQVERNEGVNVNIVSFSLLNSMYNISQYSRNNTFILRNITLNSDITITIPYGNYSVYTFRDQLNVLLANIITVTYNVATNTYTYKNISASSYSYSINPLTCSKLLGLTTTTSISPLGTTSTYVNMVSYQQVILRCPTLVFESNSLDNIQDKNNFISVSDILYWVNKQDVEPFKMINYKNEDGSTLYNYNVVNRSFSYFNFKLTNELDEPIYDAPDYLLQLQIIIYDKDNSYFKEAMIQALKLLNDIYFTILNIVSLLVKK